MERESQMISPLEARVDELVDALIEVLTLCQGKLGRHLDVEDFQILGKAHAALEGLPPIREKE